MPRPPKEVLGRLKMKSKKNIGVFSIFYILAMELFSLVFYNLENYLLFWYPLLNTLGYLFIFLSFYVLANGLKFCRLKKITILTLVAYYSFSFVSILFKIENTIYTNIANYSMILLALFVLIYSVNEKFKTYK